MSQTSTPKCPACGSKFSHDNALGQCKVCGIPDEVLVEGPKAVARWKRNPYSVTKSIGGIDLIVQTSPLTKRDRKRLRVKAQQRRRNKPGRKGVLR